MYKQGEITSIFSDYRYTTSSGTVGKIGKESKNELPLIRIKARYQTLDVLPLDKYSDLKQVCSVQLKRAASKTLISYSQK